MAKPKIRSQLRFILNGEDVALSDVKPGETLLDFLRLSRSLRGSKEGCAEGDCGACTVLVGRLHAGRLVYESVNACIRFLGSMDATHVVTIEHLAGRDGSLHPVQRAMVDFDGSQCGFCTPGFVMSLYGLWMRSPYPTNAEIEKALQGNLCRCTGYEAIMRAAHAISTYGKAAKDPLLAERKSITTRLAALRDGARVEIGTEKHRLIVPADVDDFARLREALPDATVVAGSTDVGLWVTKLMRDIAPVIFIGGLDGLKTLTDAGGVIGIGAGVTYTEAFAALSRRIPALGPLIALGATLTLRKGGRRRTIPLEKFFVAYGKQDRQPGEFVESVAVPVPAKGEKFAVYKVTKRRDEDITATLGAFWLSLAKDGTVKGVRIAYGGMAATPKRAANVEQALVGKPWTEETVLAAMEKYAEDFAPLTDMRASAEYRALAARNLLLRFHVETTGAKAPVQVSRERAA